MALTVLSAYWNGDMDVTHEWYEELPEQCPPSGAFNLDNFICYRLCEGSTPAESDFISHRALFPQKTFHAPECRARAVSVFKKPEDLDPLLKLAIHKHKAKVRITLCQADGVAMKTGNNSHYSWWRSKRFDLTLATEGNA